MLDYLKATTAAIKDIMRPSQCSPQVQASGNTACVDMTNIHYPKVYLPEIKTGYLTRHQADVYTGYWLHESLHVKYTDSPYTQHSIDNGVGDWWNALEDCRIELCAQRDNVATNLIPCLQRIREHRLNQYTPEQFEQMKTDKSALPFLTKLYLNVKAGMTLDTQSLFSVMPSDLIARLENLPTDFLKNSEQAYKLALELADIAEKNPMQPEQE